MVVTATIALVVLVETLLSTTVLRVIALLVVLLLLVLRGIPSISPAGLEGLGSGLEGGDIGSEAALRGGGVVHIELLLSLLGEVLVLSSGIVLPGVGGRHCEVDFGGVTFAAGINEVEGRFCDGPLRSVTGVADLKRP